jgi:predicted DNA-binding protein
VKQTGRSKTHFLKEALTMYLDALEVDYRKAQKVIDKAKARKEKIMNIDAFLNACSDHELYEDARDDLRTLKAMRLHWIVNEKAKPNPDKMLIAQWDEEWSKFDDMSDNLKIANRTENLEVIKKYSQQIRQWNGCDDKKASSCYNKFLRENDKEAARPQLFHS